MGRGRTRRRPLRRELDPSERAALASLASEWRAELFPEEGDAQARCLEAAVEVARRLRARGYAALVVEGSFEIDLPDPAYYDDWSAEDFGSQAALDAAMYTPLHYWTEVGRLVVDLTADQFNDELENEKMPPVVLGDYGELPRYRPRRRRLPTALSPSHLP